MSEREERTGRTIDCELSIRECGKSRAKVNDELEVKDPDPEDEDKKDLFNFAQLTGSGC